MTDEQPIAIAGPGLSAAISPLGAELQWLRDEDGHDLLWDGDSRWWTGRAPILFPVIGCVADGVVRVDGRAYPMPKHGFARHHAFIVAARSEGAVTFALEDDAGTRESYPFAFRLEIAFAIEDAALAVVATLHNRDTTPMPACFGFHPALRWPLPYGGARDEHLVRFEDDEPASIRRIGADGLLRPDHYDTPVRGKRLAPRDALFEDDALIFDELASRSATFGVPGRRTVRVSFPGMPMLGIWTKPGAPYLCIEPWQGMADRLGFTGELKDKPGAIEVAPGGVHRFHLRIECDAKPF